MRSQFARVVVVGVAALAMSACGGHGGHGKSTTRASITIVAGNAQSGVVGTELPISLSVAVRDKSGRPVAGAAVTWAVVAGGGSVTPVSITTDSAGLATARWTLGMTAGANRVTATVAGIPAVSFDATAVAGATATVTVTGPIAQIYEGDTVQLVATARDSAGNVVQGRTATWSSVNVESFPVSTTGVMQAWTYGPVTVTATIDGITGTLLLSVKPILATVTVGAKEVVFDWTTDRCEDLDVPDGPARAVRAEDASLVLFSGNAPRYYASRGPTFDSIKRDCSRPALTSADNRTPESYENWEWLWSLYREGTTWHALVHNEFHDTVASLCRIGDPSPANPCWYNSITHAVSTDGGRSFTKPLAPAHVVAPAPNAWTPPTPSTPLNGYYYYEGYRAPTNIVRSTDGYYYSLIDLTPDKAVAGMAICVMRTANLADPSSWRAWDGSGFNLRMSSPYVTGVPGPLCAALHWPIGTSSLTFNTYLGRFMLVNESNMLINGARTCGFFYVLSPDLIHWSVPQLISEARIPWCDTDPQKPGVLEPVFVLYSSLIDHADSTANFEKTGQTPYLYYTRFNDGGLDRDLVRVPLTITRTN
jgi:hypothetical protein